MKASRKKETETSSKRAENLVFRDDFRSDPVAHAAHAALLDEVFDIDIDAHVRKFGHEPSLQAFAFFDSRGHCVAALEAFILPLMISEQRLKTAALQSVAVQRDWRGHGLLRDLMDRALPWCDEIGPTLLYSETAELYERFGFRSVPQYKHVGRPPKQSRGRSGSRRLSCALDADLALVRRLLKARVPVSNHVAAFGSGPVALAKMAGNEDFNLDYASDHDALIVSDGSTDDDTFILMDVLATTMPSLADILTSLGRTPNWIEVLFPPDRLGWSGHPEQDDTGLMIRGPIPDAFAHPFMLPPTAEF